MSRKLGAIQGEEDIDLNKLESISNLLEELEGRLDENGESSLSEQTFKSLFEQDVKAAFSSGVKRSVSGNTLIKRYFQLLRNVDDMENHILPLARGLIKVLLNTIGLASNRLPSKYKTADSLLLFVCKPDDAESAAGDLFEQLEKVQSRHGKWYCNFWFFWELSLLVIVKGRKRLTKSVLGPLVDLWKRKSG